MLKRLHDLHKNQQKRVQFAWLPADINTAEHDAADGAARDSLSLPAVQFNIRIEWTEAKSLVKDHVTSL